MHELSDIALSDIQGVVERRPGTRLLRAPLTGRRCVEYRVVATLEELSHGATDPETRTVHEDGDFVTWTLGEARNARDFFDEGFAETLAEHGNERRGFDVWEPLAEQVGRAGARTWVTSSYDRRSLGQDLGELTIYALETIPMRIGGPRAAVPFESLAFVTRRRFRKAGLEEQIRRSRRRFANGSIREFRYELVEVAVVPGQRVRLMRAVATTRPGAARGYRHGEAQRGLIAPPR